MAGILPSGAVSQITTSGPRPSGAVEQVAGGGDTTPPTLSSPSGTGGTAACSGSVSTNEGNGTLYAVVTASATSPSAAQVKAGQDHTGAAALRTISQAVTATGTQTIASGSVSAGTRYLHFMHEDAAANQSAVVSSASFTVASSGDTTAPVWSVGSPAISLVGGSLTTTGAQIVWDAATDANGVSYLISIDGGATWPLSAPSNNYTFSGLSPATTYAVRVKAADPTGNETTTSLAYSLTTLTPSVPYFDLSNAVAYTFKRRGDSAVMASTAVTVWVHNPTTGALVCTITGLSTDASGLIPVVSHASMALATLYRVNYEFAGGEFGVAKLTTAAS